LSLPILGNLKGWDHALKSIDYNAQAS
jgi:hypothetical protein